MVGTREPWSGQTLNNTKQSSLREPFGRLGYVKAPRARGERARWAVAAPRLAGRAGGERAWSAGARDTEPSSARRGRAGPGAPGRDVKPPGGPAEQRVLGSAIVAAARRVGGMRSARM